MRLLQRIAHTRVARRKHPLTRLLVTTLTDLGRIEVHLHQLVHVAQDEHVRVELDDAGILGQGERGELAPAVVEARVVGEVLAIGGEEVRDALGGDAAGAEGGVAGLGEGVGVEGDERVFGAGADEGVVEGEEAGEVVGVGDEGGPDWGCWLAGG